MKRKIKISFFIAIMVFSFFNIFSLKNVNAAYGYSWTVNGEVLRRDGTSNKAGNATWMEDETYDGGVLVLNNYNGGQIKIKCNGTGLGHVFAVKLVGENKITVDKGVGVVANSPVVFIGDGKLIINAAIPIGGSQMVNSDGTLAEISDVEYNSNTTVTIVPTVKTIEKENTGSNLEEVTSSTDTIKEKEDELDSVDEDISIEKTTKPGTVIEENDFFHSDLFKIIALSYFILSLIIILLLILKIVSNKKKDKIA